MLHPAFACKRFTNPQSPARSFLTSLLETVILSRILGSTPRVIGAKLTNLNAGFYRGVSKFLFRKSLEQIEEKNPLWHVPGVHEMEG